VRRVLVAFAILALAGCAARGPAPVVERAPPAPIEVPAPEPTVEAPAERPVPTHMVKRGETLASIALQYGLDYRELAAWNNIVNPNRLETGRVLVLTPPSGATPLATAPVTTPLTTAGPPIEAKPLANTQTVKVEPRATKVPFSDRAMAQVNAAESGPSPLSADAPPPIAITPPPPAQPPPAQPPPAQPPSRVEEARRAAPDNEDIDWMWPARGKVLAPFSDTSKGMDIAGRKGAPVLAAASGRVIYADAGVRGYGKLIIIKHNDTWVSAYAHNDNILVKEQQDVRKGQKIAEMGSSDADQVKLHFEVRRQGKPVDPARVLPAM
jgi:lipoprotein NlpD